MTVRLYIERPLQSGDTFDLPAAQARHIQVVRLQPGAAITLFNGSGGEWAAQVVGMGRRDVTVRVDSHRAVDRELRRHVTLAVGMPANERMDALVEKATELGAAAIQPLVCERSVLRLSGERAARRVDHWQQVALAACEQSGRTRVPAIGAVQTLAAWLAGLGATGSPSGRRVVLARVRPEAPDSRQTREPAAAPRHALGRDPLERAARDDPGCADSGRTSSRELRGDGLRHRRR